MVVPQHGIALVLGCRLAVACFYGLGAALEPTGIGHGPASINPFIELAAVTWGGHCMGNIGSLRVREESTKRRHGPCRVLQAESVVGFRCRGRGSAWPGRLSTLVPD